MRDVGNGETENLKEMKSWRKKKKGKKDWNSSIHWCLKGYTFYSYMAISLKVTCQSQKKLFKKINLNYGV